MIKPRRGASASFPLIVTTHESWLGTIFFCSFKSQQEEGFRQCGWAWVLNLAKGILKILIVN